MLYEQAGCEGRSPLRVLMEHDAVSGVRLLEQSAREPPFVGPLGKQNRLRVARALLAFTPHLPVQTYHSSLLTVVVYVNPL